MNGVKKSLASLCAHLNLLFDMDFCTEDFRLAKFNKTEEKTTDKFWKLLNLLTLNDETVSPNRIKDFLGSVNFKTPTSDSLEQGSRELLIAVSFVLPDGLEKAIDRETKKSPFNAGFNMSREEMNPETTVDVSAFTCEQDFQRYTDWLKTRLVLNAREINELQNRNKKLLEKIRNSSLQVNGCSVNEILALNCEKYAKIFMNKTEKLTKILLNHQEWTRNESIFWQWMVSVVNSSHGENPSKTRKISFTNKTKKTSGTVR